MNKQQRKDGLLWGSFVADALSLGAHWVYNMDKIKSEIPDLRKYHNPLSIYHPSKQAGDFTHYGDMSLFFLSFISKYDFSKSEFEQDIYTAWSEFMSEYDGYLDHANRESLQNYKDNIKPSGQDTISDLSPSSRIAPFVYKFIDNIDLLKKYSLIQTVMTNNTDESKQTTLFAIDVLSDIFDDIIPSTAIKNRLLDTNLKDIHGYIKMALDMDVKTADKEVIEKFGPGCTVDGALASALFFVIKYENDFEKAVISNIACGGDSSSRGMLIGLFLGAYLGDSVVKNDLIDNMNNTASIHKILQSLT